MKHILLLGALFLFGATASAQSSSCTDKKAKTENTNSKSSCCQGKADAKSCCSAKSSCTDSKKKRGKKAKSGKEESKQSQSLARSEDKMESTDKKAKVSPAKGAGH
ncbi:MAG TPA: hypothetical protein DHV07_08525 [Flavobacteriales bacterium]|jgi:hypothetical protein|nr:hypothetical protein [Flavobacteriales bacterium]